MSRHAGELRRRVRELDVEPIDALVKPGDVLAQAGALHARSARQPQFLLHSHVDELAPPSKQIASARDTHGQFRCVAQIFLAATQTVPTHVATTVVSPDSYSSGGFERVYFTSGGMAVYEGLSGQPADRSDKAPDGGPKVRVKIQTYGDCLSKRGEPSMPEGPPPC